MPKRIKISLLALALFAGEASAQFCPGLPPWVFDDVPSTHPFCTDITWMAERSVTLGCSAIDVNHRLYCPNDSVTRGEMAAFMHRLGDALFPLSCAAGQVMKWDGLQWACTNDNIGGAGGGGTVTSVAAGIGLSSVPNPIVGAGTISLATTYRLPQACAANQIPKWNGAAWTCAADANTGGTVTSLTTGSGITLTPNPIVAAGTIAADTAYLQRRVSQSCVAGSSIRAIAADGTVTCEVDSGTNAFVHGGNAFGTTAALGTTDNRPVDVRANNNRVMRYEPDPISPNLIGGHPSNNVSAGVRGATIAGGGAVVDPDANRVTDDFGTVGGGYGNVAGDDAGTTGDAASATVAGGNRNIASGMESTVAGGRGNLASGESGSVGGGLSNTASGTWSTVAGGLGNNASGLLSTVGGGAGNESTGVGATVGGGGVRGCGPNCNAIGENQATGNASTVPGGYLNVASGDFSFAAGHRAKALGTGSFSFADSNDFDFTSNTPNAFRVRATGGVRFVVEINGDGSQAQWCLLNSATGGWSCVSDRNAKQNLVALDGRAVLEKLATMPIYAWSPIGRAAHVRHYGPMAQDFHAAFKLGDSDTMIGTQDADGVALAAIQGLNTKLDMQLKARDAIVEGQRIELAAQRAEIDELRRAMGALLARMKVEQQLAQTR